MPTILKMLSGMTTKIYQSLIHNKCLGAHHVSGTLLGPKDTTRNKTHVTLWEIMEKMNGP